jgi:hypothetical protein
MNTDFDSKGFSAVASFFGEQGIKEETAQDLKPTSTKKKRNRLGLGAQAKDDEEVLDALESEETKKKIMSIGKKRKNDDLSDEEDEHVDLSDEEDEGGRTSIKKSKKKPPSIEALASLDAVPAKKPKKKKKSKKERMAEKEIQESTDQIESDVLTPTPTDGTKKNGQDEVQEKTNAEKRKQKRKTRSKQKNIKKDSRASNEKPEHLRVGSKDYAGRPMTGETRTYLSLPESRTQKRAKTKHERFNQETETFDEGGLAIDDLLGEPVDANVEVSNPTEDAPDSGEVVNKEVVEEDANASKKKSKKVPKKKKSKFKNLK